MLDKTNRLTKRKEFNYLYKNGQAQHTAHLTLVYLPTKHRPIKIGFTVTNKIGKAHLRNLIKRRLRAIVREIVPKLPNNYNVVIIAKAGIDTITFADLKSEVYTLFNRANLQ
jgi:ribonuclease P protein component